MSDPDVKACEAVDIAAFYRFVALDDPRQLRDELSRCCRQLGLSGTILLANEGYNATVAGGIREIDTLLDRIASLTGGGTPRVHRSQARAMPFRRMKIRLKREIVSLGVNGIDPARRTGEHVPASRWNALITAPDTVLIDVRNAYEVRIGSFDGAIDPGTQHFREFDRYVDENLATLRTRRVAMFCTGGIRCEKASALMLERGIERVFQLDGGILAYLAETPRDASAWRGDCFVFDQRVAVDADLEPADYEQCPGCRRPVSAADRARVGYEAGICCPACHSGISDAQRRAFAERRRQVALAAARGDTHLGHQDEPEGSQVR